MILDSHYFFIAQLKYDVCMFFLGYYDPLGRYTGADRELKKALLLDKKFIFSI